jgi:hypothetical protein
MEQASFGEEIMRSLKLVTATVVIFLGFNNWAIGQTIVPLNTGFNHSTGSVYPVGATDNYWINISTSPTTTPAAGPAFAIKAENPWQPEMPAASGIPGTRWISAWNTIGGKGAGYTIFRKCFCLMSFTQAKLAFDVRGDDNITVWLNSIGSTIFSASPAGWANATPLRGGTTDQAKFHVGVNCLYVLLEDVVGWMGFDLRGTVSAYGLMPMPAMGTTTSFAPCGCDFSTGAGGGVPARVAAFDDRQVVQEIQKFAEARRAAKGKPAAK